MNEPMDDNEHEEEGQKVRKPENAFQERMARKKLVEEAQKAQDTERLQQDYLRRTGRKVMRP